MQQAKNDGTLPIEDHNTRIVLFGDDPQAVHSVAESDREGSVSQRVNFCRQRGRSRNGSAISATDYV